MNDEISIGKLVGNSYNPRKSFDSARMKELEGSIENQGIVQAITVRPIEGGKYEVVAGMRRFTAAKNVGLKKIPAMIRTLTDEEAKLLSITENLERADLTPIEEARSFAEYLGWDEQHHFEDGRERGIIPLTELLASKIPMSLTTIYARLGLLHLPDSLQTRVEQGTLPITYAEVLVRLKTLWPIRTTGMTEDEIKSKQNTIKSGIQGTMEEIAKTITKTKDNTAYVPSLSDLKKRVNQYIEAEQMNLGQREKLAGKLKGELDEVREKLQGFYDELQNYPSNWDSLSPEERQDWVESYLQEQIKKLADDELERISKTREIRSSQHDRYLMNLAYVRELALSTCPHCGAAVKVDFLERKIGELQEDIASLSEEEGITGKELGDWRSKKNQFEKITREYTSKFNTYNASIKGALDE